MAIITMNGAGIRDCVSLLAASLVPSTFRACPTEAANLPFLISCYRKILGKNSI